MIDKLKLKFVMINMLIISIILFISMGILYYSTSNDLKQRSINMMENIITNPYKLKVIEEHSDEIGLPYFAVLLDSSGKIENVIGGYYDLSNIDLLQGFIDEVMDSNKTIGELHDVNLRYLYSQSSENNRIVFSDISNEKAILKSLLNTCIRIYMLSFAAFLVISILLAKWAVKPVQQAWEQQKQFIADASHELKTPLTVITTNAELLENAKYHENDIHIFSNNILNMSKQMRILLERMIELAKGDIQAKTKNDQIDMSKLIFDGILPYEAIFFEKNLDLQYHIEENIKIKGDVLQIKQILDILLDNALKYSTIPGMVEVSLKKQNKKYCVLVVSNTGEKISLEQSKLIFQRFYRADYAHTCKGSVGLGLAIAKNIVMNHKGKIWVESDNDLNSFFVKLPLS